MSTIRQHALSPLILAVLVTLLGCFQPLQSDEDPYYRVASHIADHPGDPYGFKLGSMPANHMLAPPVLLYWWSLAIRLFGIQPILWKLWLLPFSLLLVFALQSLAARFCRGLETPLVWLSVLSPSILPCFNLMLDVPALALSLSAVALFLRAGDQGSILLAALAGLICGVAMETKYTALVTPGVFVLAGLMFRRPWLAVLAAGLAWAVFVSWEATTAQLYGESHFLHSFAGQRHDLRRPLQLVLPLVAILGGVAPGVALLELSASGLTRRGVVAAGIAVVVGYLLILCVPAPFDVILSDPSAGRTSLTLNNLVFGGLGLAVCGSTLLATWRLIRGAHSLGASNHASTNSSSRADGFLVVWLALELAGYFALSPFPAVRRVLGLVVVGTLIAGRLAARTSQLRPGWVPIRGLALANIFLGLGMFAIELRDASAEPEIVRETARFLHQHPSGTTAWFQSFSNSGFNLYAKWAGLKPLNAPAGAAPGRGDWLAVMYRPYSLSDSTAPQGWGEPQAQFKVEDRLPLRMIPCYWSGRTALEHHHGPRAVVDIYRHP